MNEERDFVREDMENWVGDVALQIRNLKEELKVLSIKLEVASARHHASEVIYKNNNNPFEYQSEFKERYVDPALLNLNEIQEEYNKLEKEIEIKEQHELMIKRYVNSQK
ncbi:hypothetical protein IHV09_14250 [Fictibacillus sp. 23RED33]|uniref:hypothetical protein n=1 Tax=Fictibacillus sp. 23RED33 TaxID=2745879 RepID=UPI0018CE051F|nr:hypothetical protein [Fictibacillus sp. 23RED33]MBH0174726.1 hypothetical protein [Fictibacillus sp. 23RED33]